MIDDIAELAANLREMAPERSQPFPDVPHILEVAADVLEEQESLIQSLASDLANGVELLEIIKEHWIDYDHIYSIFCHEAKELSTKALSKPNQMEEK